MPKLTKIQKQNIRTVMQAFHGCRKNCAECREEEQEWEKGGVYSELSKKENE